MVDNPKKAHGDLKPGIRYVAMWVMLSVAKVMELGAKKYGLRNWRKQPITASTYHEAIFRHLVQWYELGEDIDEESGQSHLAHIMAGCMIILDAQKHKTLIDDRHNAEVLHPN